MDRSAADISAAVLSRYGTTFADEAGIDLENTPAPLFQLLVLAELLSARIGAGVAVAAAVELNTAGWTTAAAMRDAKRQSVIAALGRAGYRRYDERTATELRAMAELVRADYGGDLRRLADEADGDVAAAARLVQEVRGIGPTGAAVFLREVQAVWPWVRPFLDERAREGARRIGLPDSSDELAELVGSPEDLARFAAGLVRVSRLPKSQDAFDGRPVCGELTFHQKPGGIHGPTLLAVHRAGRGRPGRR